MSEAARILIVDDEVAAVENLAHVCRKAGHEVTTRTSSSAAFELLESQEFDLVLSDLRMERVDGMAILRRVKELQPETAVVLITGYATLDSAVAAMKAGAFHYIAKPFRLDEVREVVRTALELVRLKRENRQLKRQLNQEQAGPTIITQDAGMLRLLDTARQVAATDTTVLIGGESGTGKELLARYIHGHSGRREGCFQALNCGALQEELLANELFGHEKGAYTGASEARPGLIESAQGGTLFLDEIAEMSSAMQIKLLRVIQERELVRLGASHPIAVDIRLIAASHRDLRAEVAAGRFRQDLYYRLDVVGLQLPPLAQRRDDIPLLAFYFLRKYVARMGRHVEEIEPAAMAALQAYDYPGNIRELENIIERGVALAHGSELTDASLPPSLTERTMQVVREEAGRLPTLAERETDYIRYVLERSGGNRTRAAQILGIDRVSLWRKLKKYGMDEG
ncbi:sigma-54-dependent transcriptional regulator [Candidatus Endoriftia persephone]|jgi:DNA-binding NtrC family response regulator|uniref:Acetoacetate metabolism regulatory protein AtoC n=3 Tax=Gammaproteobacteria TaxID=1236 RepID=G2FBA2_9GAMM|nr:sigma-54 dependent transcriptional regulator [Candidatus Endoriftia persephone]EGV52600.1 acetoacetate metabolism regulatory protein AtoC [endosymbiont of Riftia pachyptila (vent Ph05)]EGW56040.1 acetoacetate metabolism regulatory protein AtoC [endosymbiont of Tevnia jerichonana (vent Tica)]USF88163.1 sigma-54 dependent transcriptional regulator [Candidatus Endoriftia persephone]